jgi:hypothetical protein
MARVLAFAGTCVLLFGVLIIGIGPDPAYGDTIFRLEAFQVPNGHPGWTFDWRDVNDDGIYSGGVDLYLNFSGFLGPTGDGSVPFTIYDRIIYIPLSPGALPYTAGPSELGYPDSWMFEGFIPTHPNVTLRVDVGEWTYVRTVVPLPPSVFLLASGLIPLAWARRKRPLGK